MRWYNMVFYLVWAVASSLNVFAQQLKNPKYDARELDFTADGTGQLWLAWVKGTTKEQSLYVSRFEQGIWQPVGERLNFKGAQTPMLRASPDDSMWLGWSELSGDGDVFHLKHWDGTAWQYLVQQRQSIDLSYAARSRSLSIDTHGTPFFSWSEIGSGGINLKERYWDDKRQLWIKSKPLNLKPESYAFQSVARANSTTKAVVWLEGNAAYSDVWVKTFQNGIWKQVGTEALNFKSPSYTANPNMQLDDQGFPVVVWVEEVGGIQQIMVRRWDGQKWLWLGKNLNTHPKVWAVKPSIALNGKEIWLAWTEETIPYRTVVVKHWNGATWKAYGKLGQQDAFSPVLAASPTGVYVAWLQGTLEQHQVRFQKLNP